MHIPSFLKGFAAKTPKPKAIVLFSAHWEKPLQTISDAMLSLRHWLSSLVESFSPLGTGYGLGAALIVITMLIAIFTVHGKQGYWATSGGFEHNLVLIALAIGVALIGPGQYVLF
jgi:hypothetical protein